MSNLAKWVEIARAEKERTDEIARRHVEMMSRPGGEIAILRYAPVCYIPGFCSKTRRRIVFRCQYSTEAHGYQCNRIISADSMSRDEATAANEYARGEKVKWYSPLKIPCGCCGVVVHSFPNFRAGGSWHCECGAINCYGSYRVIDGELIVTCGACGSEGALGYSFHTDASDAIFERDKQPPRPAGSVGPGSGLVRLKERK